MIFRIVPSCLWHLDWLHGPEYATEVASVDLGSSNDYCWVIYRHYEGIARWTFW